jgi:hypothetical protein
MQSKDSNDKIFADPVKVADVGDCYFYHTMELPGYGVINGEWDLRRGVDEYLGEVLFAGQRVLEIGPASGFLTFEMEKRGAEIISVEVGFCSVSRVTTGRDFRAAANCDATFKEFILVQSCFAPLPGQSVLRRRLQLACRPREIRHRSDGGGAVALPRSAPDR